MNKKLVVKAILLYKKNGTFYFLELTRSPRKNFCPLMGDLPGGKVDAGETPLDGIKREVQEETGIIVSIFNLLHVHEWGEFEERIYWAVVDTQEVILAPDEHISYRWIALDDIGQSTLHPNVIKIIEHEKEQIVKLVERR